MSFRRIVLTTAVQPNKVMTRTKLIGVRCYTIATITRTRTTTAIPSVYYDSSSVTTPINKTLLRTTSNSSPTAAKRLPFSTNAKNTTTTDTAADLDQLVQHAIATVRQFDAAGYLPGQLLSLPSFLPGRTTMNRQQRQRMSQAYYAVRSFWIETGLRFGSTAQVPPNSSPMEHLQWWQDGIDFIFPNTTDVSSDPPTTLSAMNRRYTFENHPTLNLLRVLYADNNADDNNNTTRQRFHNVLDGRRKDLDVKQYETINDLIRHAEQSCGSILQLVLESGNITVETNPIAHDAARLVGICHGITNSLRNSIPVLSTTGKLIIPLDLCQKYEIQSPRYLLSSLGMGDEKCRLAMEYAVRDICQIALDHLQQARALHSTLRTSDQGDRVMTVLLPGLACETFLSRLQECHFQLTDRSLRNVSFIEHTQCAARMVSYYYQSKY